MYLVFHLFICLFVCLLWVTEMGRLGVSAVTCC